MSLSVSVCLVSFSFPCFCFKKAVKSGLFSLEMISAIQIPCQRPKAPERPKNGLYSDKRNSAQLRSNSEKNILRNSIKFVFYIIASSEWVKSCGKVGCFRHSPPVFLGVYPPKDRLGPSNFPPQVMRGRCVEQKRTDIRENEPRTEEKQGETRKSTISRKRLYKSAKRVYNSIVVKITTQKEDAKP